MDVLAKLTLLSNQKQHENHSQNDLAACLHVGKVHYTYLTTSIRDSPLLSLDPNSENVLRNTFDQKGKSELHMRYN